MNMNRLLYEIKKKVGLTGQFAGVVSDRDLRDIIFTSLDEFNRYSSFEIRMSFSTFFNTFMDVPGYENIGASYTGRIELDMPETIRHTIEKSGSSIKLIRILKTKFSNVLPTTRNMREDMRFIDSSMTRSFNCGHPSIQFRAPKTIIMNGIQGNVNFFQAYEVIISVTHPKSLSTITPGLERLFEQLCRHNIELMLYNNEIRFMNIDLGVASVDLNLENFSNAENEKKDLLEELKSRSNADYTYLRGN